MLVLNFLGLPVGVDGVWKSFLFGSQMVSGSLVSFLPPFSRLAVSSTLPVIGGWAPLDLCFVPTQLELSVNEGCAPP